MSLFLSRCSPEPEQAFEACDEDPIIVELQRICRVGLSQTPEQRDLTDDEINRILVNVLYNMVSAPTRKAMQDSLNAKYAGLEVKYHQAVSMLMRSKEFRPVLTLFYDLVDSTDEKYVLLEIPDMDLPPLVYGVFKEAISVLADQLDCTLDPQQVN